VKQRVNPGGGDVKSLGSVTFVSSYVDGSMEFILAMDYVRRIDLHKAVL